jgi:hypothetical protein
LDVKGKKWRETGEDCIMRSFTTCTLHQILLGNKFKENDMSGSCSTHVEMRNPYKILVGKLEMNRLLGKPRCKRENNRVDLRETEWDGEIEFIWLRTGTNGGLLWTQ